MNDWTGALYRHKTDEIYALTDTEINEVLQLIVQHEGNRSTSDLPLMGPWLIEFVIETKSNKYIVAYDEMFTEFRFGNNHQFLSNDQSRVMKRIYKEIVRRRAP